MLKPGRQHSLHRRLPPSGHTMCNNALPKGSSSKGEDGMCTVQRPSYQGMQSPIRTPRPHSRAEQCDETKPTCVNCVRYSSTCSYSVKKTSPDALCGDTYLDTSGNRLPSFSFADFELLHHWTLATAESLAPNASLQRAMREIVPRLAMKYRYLMWAKPFVFLLTMFNIV